jgi:hypothetical protein
MDQLKKQVAKARRRMTVQRFLGALGWCWFVTLLAAAIAIGIQKWLLVSVEGTRWATWWIAGAVAGGLLLAAVWTWWTRYAELEAAMEIDRRFGLKERISSSLALAVEDVDTPAGQALVDDAQRRISRLEVDTRFPVKLSRWAWLPLASFAAAFALCFLSDPTQPKHGDASASTVKISKQINEATEALRKKLEERAQQAGEKGLKENEDLLKKIEEGTRELTKKDSGDRHEALAKMNDLSKELEQRRDKLAEGEKLKDELAAMKNLPSGPADKLAKDMKDGDFGKALKELDNLKDQLAQGKLDPKDQQKLAEQLDAMKSALQKASDAHEKMKTELQKQIDTANKAGDQQAAKNLQQQLNKLQAQQPRMDKVKDMADKLGQAAKDMKDGNMQQAQNGLNQLASDLAQMAQDQAEMQMLESTLDAIDDAKAAMNCPNCGGAGCELCQKGMLGDSKGLGRQEGAEGERPEQAENTKMYDSRVRQNIGKGSGVVTGLVEGPNAKGQAVEEIKGEVEAAKHDSADPLTGQRLPRSQRDHVLQYFDAFRKGQ